MELSGDKLLELLEEKGIEVQEVTRTTSINKEANTMGYELSLLNIIMSLIVTVFVYLFVPIVIILRKKEYTIKKIKRIAIINGIVCFLIFSVIQIETGGDGASAGACALWSFVGYHLMKKNCLIEDNNKTKK